MGGGNKNGKRFRGKKKKKWMGSGKGSRSLKKKGVDTRRKSPCVIKG